MGHNRTHAPQQKSRENLGLSPVGYVARLRGPPRNKSQTANLRRDIGSRRQLRLGECGAVVLAVALVFVVLRRDEALDREIWRPL
jgi:hypothetical protein